MYFHHTGVAVFFAALWFDQANAWEIKGQRLLIFWVAVQHAELLRVPFISPGRQAERCVLNFWGGVRGCDLQLRPAET